MKIFVKLLLSVLAATAGVSLLIYGSNASAIPSMGRPSFSNFGSDPDALMPGETGSGGLAGDGDSSVPFPNPGLAADYFAQKSRNSKTTAWIAIPNVCYYPVMFSGDNTYYIDHDAYNSYGKQGAIFINASGKLNFDGGAVLTHGHHVKDGYMYAWLERYQNENFFRANNPIELFDGEYLRYYIPFTVLSVKDSADMIDLTEKSPADYKAYMTGLLEQSVVKMAPYKTPDLTAPTLFLGAFVLFLPIYTTLQI
ncbi:MAG: class B sortase [Oscillospiraceae bacterium]|nr:class B sortase [Oscillospiraceae bacterium]